MIKDNHSDSIFSSNAEALVNTVNCVGVMGKGIALIFRDRFDDYYEDYREKCRHNKIKLGQTDVFQTELIQPVFIVSFPTKRHWKEKAFFHDIELGLESLIQDIHDYDIKSIAIPKLGCGLGGLKWDLVYKLIKKELDPVEGCEITVYHFQGE